jgi:adenosylcobinamide-GDP ribazoletransferase
MRYLKGLYMAVGMFTGIPLPFYIWDEKLMPLMVAALPLVGLIVGGLWWGIGLIFTAFEPPAMLAAAILAVTPFFAAGFIHLDGYMDTSDALLSRRPMADRLCILKDPRVGAFAVVMLAVLFLLQFAAMYTVIGGGYLALLIVICVISRGCSAFSILALRHMPQSNYAAMLGATRVAPHRIFVIIAVLGAMSLATLYAGIIGLIVALSVILSYGLAMRKVFKSFNGVSGDLLGYALIISELCGLIALGLIQEAL